MKYSVRSILFLGVGGISMHQLAIAFKDMGSRVYGYDLHKSKYTQLCVDKGIRVVYKFNKSVCNVDLCVATGAVKNNKFFNYLKKQNIPVIDRADILGWLCKKFSKVIAVAGTHGKSTTASLIYEILRKSGKKVSCHIGAEVKKPRFVLGDEYLVVEACEYNKSFLKLKPTVSVVTNVEKEHMESYKTLFNLRLAFLRFMRSANERFAYVDNSTKFLKKCNTTFINKTELTLLPTIKGDYNLKNISLAVGVCKNLGIRDETIIDAINNFKGIPRRNEFIGEYFNSKIYLDYAHHPTEVKAFVDYFKSENQTIQIVFQPHTYSRTKTFLKEFKEIFSKVENLIIYKEYSAREKPENGLTAKDLFLEIKKINPNVKYCDNFNALMNNLIKKGAVAFVGAGDINLVAEKIILASKINLIT